MPKFPYQRRPGDAAEKTQFKKGESANPRGRARPKTEKAVDALNVRERLFVKHYMANGGNAAAAARSAGYKTTGPSEVDNSGPIALRMLKREAIQKALQELGAELDEKLGLGDMAEHIRIHMLEAMMEMGFDRVPAASLLAKMTPGALAPAEIDLGAKKSFAELVLAAQRKRELAEPDAPAALEPAEPTPE